MPLPAPVARKALHQRRIELNGFRRHDGLFDIEARMVDTKTQDMILRTGRPVPAGESIHDMTVRLTVDTELRVVDVVACTDAAPFGACPAAPGTLQALRGLKIGAGWSRAIAERLGGAKGCTHLNELLKPLATVAFQTLWQVRERRPTPADAAGRPLKIDSCLAFAGDGEVVRQLWPMHAVPHRSP